MNFYKSYIIATLSIIIRYYDYSIFGLSAGLIAKYLLPSGSIDQQLMIFYTIFSATALLRPVGSLIFGYIGDKYGRTVSVKIATLLAAISAILLGIVPGYHIIGNWTLFFLLIARILFIISLSGETDGIKIYIYEMTGPKERGLAIGILSFFSQIGVIIASYVIYLAMNSEQTEIVWRINFVAGGVCGLFLLYFRRNLVESQKFQNQKNTENPGSDSNLFELIRGNFSSFILALLLYGLIGGVYNFLIIFLSNFLISVAKIADPLANIGTNLVLIYAISCAISGYLSDKVNFFNQTIVSLVITISLSTCLQYNLLFGYNVIWHYLITFSVPFFTVPIQIMLQSLFISAIRMRLCAFSHSLGSMLFSSTVPVVYLYVWQQSNLISSIIYLFMLQIILILLSILYLRKSSLVN